MTKFNSFLLSCFLVLSVSCNFQKVTVLDIPQFETSVIEMDQSVDEALAEANAALEEIASLNPAEANFENTVVRLEDIYYQVDLVSNRIGIISATSLNEEMRNKADELDVKISNWYVDVSARKDIYESVMAYANKGEELTGEDKLLLDETVKGYKRVGFHLSEELQAEVAVLKKELSSLTTDIAKNIKIAASANTVLLTPAQVAGTPEEVLVIYSKDENGNYIVRVGVTYEATMILQNCPIEETRKLVFTARNSAAQDSNAPLMEQVILKRAKLAKLLGYKSWADYQLESRMAQTGDRAKSFVADLVDALEPKFQQEVSVMQQLKAKHTGKADAVFNAWDRHFYVQMLEKEQYSLDLESLKKYFEFNRTLQGMFRTFEKVFKIKIEAVAEEYYKWAPEVQLVKISDAQTGKDLGLLYLDMFPRPEQGKYGHFAMFTIRSNKLIQGFMERRPVAALICNFPAATADKPSLLSLDQVQTLYHEFGHGLHGLLTQTKYATFAGTRVARDFVEVPSQSFERWVTDPNVLKSFAVNYEDETDSFPLEMIEKIDQASQATIGMHYRRQFSFGLMDLKMHSEIAEDDEFNIVDYTNTVLADVFLPFPEGSSFVTAFGHLFGGYDAGYYGYAWADVLAADVASVFKASPKGFLDEELGMRLRNAVYATGSSRDVNVSIEEFLQRPVSNQAFVEMLGIKK